MQTPDPARERIIERTRDVLVHENRWWRVFDDEVLIHDRPGRHLRLEPASGKPGAVVLAVRDGRVGLVRQYRYAQQCSMWELPRGFAEPGDVDPAATAARELGEETGLTVVAARHLGDVTTDSSIVVGKVAVYLVSVTDTEEVHGQGNGAVSADPSGDPNDEVDAVVWVPLVELQEMIRANEIHDGFTLAALALAWVTGAF